MPSPLLISLISSAVTMQLLLIVMFVSLGIDADKEWESKIHVRGRGGDRGSHSWSRWPLSETPDSGSWPSVANRGDVDTNKLAGFVDTVAAVLLLLLPELPHFIAVCVCVCSAVAVKVMSKNVNKIRIKCGLSATTRAITSPRDSCLPLSHFPYLLLSLSPSLSFAISFARTLSGN